MTDLSIPPESYVIESAGKAFGLVVRNGKRFMFHACDPAVWKFDRQEFASANHAGLVVRKHLARFK